MPVFIGARIICRWGGGGTLLQGNTSIWTGSATLRRALQGSQHVWLCRHWCCLPEALASKLCTKIRSAVLSTVCSAVSTLKPCNAVDVAGTQTLSQKRDGH